MISTDTSKPQAVAAEQRVRKRTDSDVRRRRTDQESADSASVIPFPAEPAPQSRPAMKTAGPRIFSLPLRQALRETMEPVLRRARAANELAGCLVLELDSYREIEETFGH